MITQPRYDLRPVHSAIRKLPTELLIPIFQYVLLQDLLALRVTCRRFCQVIATHSSIICPEVANNQFPRARFLLQVRQDRPRNLSWLQSLVPKYLAAVAVGRYPEVENNGLYPISHPQGISPESEIGDLIRRRVDIGFCIWKKLSDISKGVYALPVEQIPPSMRKENKKERGKELGRLAGQTYIARQTYMVGHSPWKPRGLRQWWDDFKDPQYGL